MTDDARARATPEVVHALEELAEQLARRPFSRDLIHRMEWLVELLIERGYLEPGHRALINRDRGDGSVVRLSMYRDKRSVSSADPGCAERMHLCKARCCALDVALSAEDIAEGLRWELNQPYLLPRAEHGYCEHLRQDGRCGAYERRPAVCRAYDCVGDTRIWIDYDAMIPAPMPWSLVPGEHWHLSAEERHALIAARFPPAPPPLEAGVDEDTSASTAGAREPGGEPAPTQTAVDDGGRPPTRPGG